MNRLTVAFLVLTLFGAMLAPFATADDTRLDSLHAVGQALLWYPTNRINDVTDAVHASLGFGLGYGFGLRATSMLGVELSDYNTCRWGWDEGGVLPTVWDQDHKSGGADFFTLGCGKIEHDGAEIGAEVHLAVIGVSAGVDCYEIVDAISGLFLLDFSEDDEGPTFYSHTEPEYARGHSDHSHH
jgi:hypothetical protein